MRCPANGMPPDPLSYSGLGCNKVTECASKLTHAGRHRPPAEGQTKQRRPARMHGCGRLRPGSHSEQLCSTTRWCCSTSILRRLHNTGVPMQLCTGSMQGQQWVRRRLQWEWGAGVCGGPATFPAAITDRATRLRDWRACRRRKYLLHSCFAQQSLIAHFMIPKPQSPLTLKPHLVTLGCKLW